jgi:hypothetical protein
VLKSQSATIPGPDGKLDYLFRLGGVLGSKEKVMDVAGLSQGEPRGLCSEVMLTLTINRAKGRGRAG